MDFLLILFRILFLLLFEFCVLLMFLYMLASHESAMTSLRAKKYGVYRSQKQMWYSFFHSVLLLFERFVGEKHGQHRLKVKFASIFGKFSYFFNICLSHFITYRVSLVGGVRVASSFAHYISLAFTCMAGLDR